VINNTIVIKCKENIPNVISIQLEDTVFSNVNKITIKGDWVQNLGD